MNIPAIVLKAPTPKFSPKNLHPISSAHSVRDEVGEPVGSRHAQMMTFLSHRQSKEFAAGIAGGTLVGPHPIGLFERPETERENAQNAKPVRRDVLHLNFLKENPHAKGPLAPTPFSRTSANLARRRETGTRHLRPR